LSALNRCEAKYLVVGGYAVMVYTEPRYTKDLDIWVESTPDNALRVFRALAEFGAPLAGMNPAEFEQPDVIYQLGIPPSRIDVLTSITGVEFADAWGRKTVAMFGDVRACFINPEDLIQNKRATGRPTDLVDCARLEETRKRRGQKPESSLPELSSPESS
jgi:hypothetical protein